MPGDPPNTCPNEECGGSGYVDNEPCPTCFGAGALPIKGGPARILKELSEHREMIVTIATQVQVLYDDLNQ